MVADDLKYGGPITKLCFVCGADCTKKFYLVPVFHYGQAHSDDRYYCEKHTKVAKA